MVLPDMLCAERMYASGLGNCPACKGIAMQTNVLNRENVLIIESLSALL